MFEGVGLALAMMLPAETTCLAQNIYFEARNQSYVGKIATAHVVFNRMGSADYPNTVCDVVKQAKYDKNGRIIKHKCQFSWYCDGLSDKPKEEAAWKEAVKAANDAATLWENGYDVTDGADHYHSKNVKPKWSRNMTLTTQIDDHLFYKD